MNIVDALPAELIKICTEIKCDRINKGCVPSSLCSKIKEFLNDTNR